MKASTLCLCLGLGLSTFLPTSDAGARVVYRPTLAAGKVSSSAGAVVAGPDGAEWLIPGGARLAASPGAELRVIGAPQRLALGPRKNTPGYTVMLRRGEVRVFVPEGGKSAVVIGAPRKTNVLVVSGTASVAASDERVLVANADGETSFRIGPDPLRPLKPGMLRQVDSAGGAHRPLAASPASMELPSVLLAFDGQAPSPAMRWPAAAGASGYRVEIRDEKGRSVEQRELASTALEARAFRLVPGTYSARLVGLDPSGLEARAPVERSFRVVGVSVPERGYVDTDGVLHFPAGRRIALSNTDGIEVTYGAGTFFAAAPSTLEVARAEPRLVRFRARGEKAESRLWVVPHKAHAKVEFGPALPTWPGDPLEIRVRVAQGASSSPLGEIEARPKVLVGVDPVPVEFTREGGTLRGVLPPQSGKGPWVVRVEVEDESGIPLGRDFIEVGQR